MFVIFNAFVINDNIKTNNLKKMSVLFMVNEPTEKMCVIGILLLLIIVITVRRKYMTFEVLSAKQNYLKLLKIKYNKIRKYPSIFFYLFSKHYNKLQ